MAAEIKNEIALEIAHVLFIDIVAYSKMATDQQRAAVDKLNQIVQSTDEVRQEESERRLLKIATGDGMALIFYHSPEDPVECALEISRAIREQHANLRLRMGVHSGPVNGVVDVNGQANVAGAGINMAQRVMDCGDAGHILLSKRVAEDLEHFTHWRPHLYHLGECEVKHGDKIEIVNLFTAELGNPERPQRLNKPAGKAGLPSIPNESSKSERKTLPILIACAVVAALAIGAFLFWKKQNAGMSASASAAPQKSVAVLPFENLSSDKENAFFTDGVQDEILTDLSKIADLKVISRTSVMQYKTGQARNLREIGQQLGVAHVVEGSVQRAANKVRVNAQLIDARTDAHLWAQVYDRDLADVFAIQTEIAAAIAQQLAVHMSAVEKEQIAKPPTNDLVAYDLYRRARELDDQSNNPNAKDALLQGITLLEEAVRRDPKFLRAYCLMCETHLDLYWEGFDHTPQRRDLARVALQHAEEIQPDAGEVHWQKGIYAYHGFRDYDRARAELEMAKQLLPNEARIPMTIGAVDRRSQRWPEAVTNFNRAVELDPRNFVVLLETGSTYSGVRRFEEGRRFFERALAIVPNDPFARNLLGFSKFGTTGDTAAWRKELDLVANQGDSAAREIAFPLLLCSWMQRDRSAAEKAVALIPAEGIANSFDEAAVPREYCVGRTAWLFGDKNAAKPALEAARAIFERETQEQPDYSQAWTYLGLTDAMLGRCEDAVREGKRACEVLPYTKDSWIGSIWQTNLALIYARCGDKDAALKELANSAQLAAGISYGELKQSPDWDSLSNDPRFDKILDSLAPK